MRTPLIFLLLLIMPATWADSNLDDLHRKISGKFPEVHHINADQLDHWLSSSANQETILFDVREKDEFAVSHLEHAIRVDPDISAKQFLSEFGSLIRNKNVVLYCSVGYRSSDLAEQLQDRSADSTANFYNLQHGVFGWHNNQRPLVSAQGETDSVHPYSRRWESYLQRKDAIRYE